jgi:hypothetical protein
MCKETATVLLMRNFSNTGSVMGAVERAHMVPNAASERRKTPQAYRKAANKGTRAM